MLNILKEVKHLRIVFILFISGCTHFSSSPAIPTELYGKVAEAFVMVAREDVAKNGEATWSQASGFSVEEDGRHYIYTARHVVIDKKKGDALPRKLYATTLKGESHAIDLSRLEVPQGGHDAVRVELPVPICRELRLAKRPPRYGERIFAFGDAGGAGVMCAETGVVLALGPLEFEHTADSIGGMSGGPVVDLGGDVVGLCQKGRKTTARKNGIALESDSRYLRLRNFAALLHGIGWKSGEQVK